MRDAGTFKRFVAAFMTMAIAGYWVPATTAATSSPQFAEIRGNILAADGLTAVAGVSVKAANMETRQVYTSAATGEDGGYLLKQLPPGSYDIAVETPQGLYAADLLVDVHAGKRRVVSLALKPGAQDPGAQDPGAEAQTPEDPNAVEGEKEEPKADEGKKDEKPPEQPEPQEQKKKKKGGGFWRSPAGAAILIVGGAGLLGAAANSAAGNDDNTEEPMTPGGT